MSWGFGFCSSRWQPPPQVEDMSQVLCPPFCWTRVSERVLCSCLSRVILEVHWCASRAAPGSRRRCWRWKPTPRPEHERRSRSSTKWTNTKTSCPRRWGHCCPHNWIPTHPHPHPHWPPPTRVALWLTPTSASWSTVSFCHCVSESYHRRNAGVFGRKDLHDVDDAYECKPTLKAAI